ncbi:MAG TPA: universal stress protein, partial [Gaiellaceae bacterium]|nr:universal stress protein [Gaiellaceae bacterium]
MRKVLAAVDNSAAARPVLAVAEEMARLFRGRVEAVHIREDGDRTAAAEAQAAGVPLRELEAESVVDGLLEAGRSRDIAAVVLGARGARTGRRPAGHVALELIVGLRKPVVVVPPSAPVPCVLERILVPLDATRATAAALARTVDLASRCDIAVVALHVHDERSLPPFGDQPQHELEAWSHEFLARYCPGAEQARLEVRVGAP